MSIPICTHGDLEQIVRSSGFPFELDIAHSIQEAGYQVQLSYWYHDQERDCSREVDIIATRSQDRRTRHAGLVRTVLELAIECKDNALPYVLFGFPTPSPSEHGLLDLDTQCCKVRSTQDKCANHLAFVAIEDGRLPSSASLRSRHHQFNEPTRYHQVASVELHAKKFKLVASNRLHGSLQGLAGYVAYVLAEAPKVFRDLEAMCMPYDPTIWLTFSLLVHRGQHYRYDAASGLQVSPHTTLFTSLSSSGLQLPYAIDFVEAARIGGALQRIEQTYEVISNHLIRYLRKSPRPLVGSLEAPA